MAPELRFNSFGVPYLVEFANVSFRSRSSSPSGSSTSKLSLGSSSKLSSESSYSLAACGSRPPSLKRAPSVRTQNTLATASSETLTNHADDDCDTNGLFIQFKSSHHHSPQKLSPNRLLRLKRRIARAVVAAGMDSSPATEWASPEYRTTPVRFSRWSVASTESVQPPPMTGSLFRGTYGQVMMALQAAGLETVPCKESGLGEDRLLLRSSATPHTSSIDVSCPRCSKDIMSVIPCSTPLNVHRLLRGLDVRDTGDKRLKEYGKVTDTTDRGAPFCGSTRREVLLAQDPTGAAWPRSGWTLSSQVCTRQLRESLVDSDDGYWWRPAQLDTSRRGSPPSGSNTTLTALRVLDENRDEHGGSAGASEQHVRGGGGLQLPEKLSCLTLLDGRARAGRREAAIGSLGRANRLRVRRSVAGWPGYDCTFPGALVLPSAGAGIRPGGSERGTSHACTRHSAARGGPRTHREETTIFDSLRRKFGATQMVTRSNYAAGVDGDVPLLRLLDLELERLDVLAVVVSILSDQDQGAPNGQHEILGGARWQIANPDRSPPNTSTAKTFSLHLGRVM
ncbi:hypothetical protein CERSUDRAFT_126744, partial [Gelatoporia subvermispora B]